MTLAKQQTDDEEMVQAGYRFALSLAGDRHVAEDLVQQACLRVLHKKGRLDSRSYLFTAIRNLFYDSLRRKKLVAFEPLDPMAASLPAKTTPRPCARLDLESSLNLLSPEEREAIYLNCVEGYSAAEIGTMLGKPRSTVLNVLARAKARLIAEEGTTPMTTQQGGIHG